MDKKLDAHKLNLLFFNIVQSYNKFNTLKLTYGTDVNISFAEIHMLSCIGTEQKVNVITLAKQLDITKGAVSKKIKNLEKKGLVLKQKAPHTDNEVQITLSKQGFIAFNEHKKIENSINENLETIYGSISKELTEELFKIGDETNELFKKIYEERVKNQND